MSNPTANPLGAGGDVTKAALKIGELLRKPEPQGQPEQQQAPVQANPADTTKPVTENAERPRDPVTKRFVKAEPQADEAKPEGEQPEVEAQAETSDQTADDTEELAEDVDDLAKQLGLEPDNLLEHLKAKVKVGGEERRVNLKELLSGYSMESDYRQKTAKIADERRQFEAERAQVTQQREQLSKELTPLVQQLEQLVGEDDQQLRQLLESGDILEYERAKFRAEQRRNQLQIAKHQQQRLAEEQQRESRIKLEQDVISNEQMLVAAHPEWAKDVDKGKRELAEIRQYLKAQGVPGDHVDSLYDARSILIAEKAMKYEKLLKETKDKVVKAQAAPLKFQKPGPAKAAEDPKKQAIRVSLQRLRKTGDHRDAAKAIKALGLV